MKYLDRELSDQQVGHCARLLLDEDTIEDLARLLPKYNPKHITCLMMAIGQAVNDEKRAFPDSMLSRVPLSNRKFRKGYRILVPSLMTLLEIMSNPRAMKRVEQRKPRTFQQDVQPGVMTFLEQYTSDVLDLLVGSKLDHLLVPMPPDERPQPRLKLVGV